MSQIFRYLTLEKGREWVQSSQPADADIARKLYAGDHFLDGDGWIGPMPKRGDRHYAATCSKIRRAFVSQNVVREIVLRKTGALVGREPAFGVTPQPRAKKHKTYRDRLRGAFDSAKDAVHKAVTGQTATQKLVDEVEDALDAWWDKRGVHNILSAAVTAMLVESHCPLRLLVPAGKMETETLVVDGELFVSEPRLPRVNSLAEALDFLYVQRLEGTSCATAIDPSTFEEGAVYCYQTAKGVLTGNIGTGMQTLQVSMSGQTIHPASTGDPTAPDRGGTGTYRNDTFHPEQRPAAGTELFSQGDYGMEVCWTENGKTFVRIVSEEEGVNPTDANAPGQRYVQEHVTELDLGGRLPIYEMRTDPMVTPQIRQNQYQLNRTLTMMGHNVDLAGFVERIFLNADDGVGQDDTGEDEAITTENHGDLTQEVGAAITSYIKGVSFMDESGNTKYMQPSVVFRQPVSPEPLIETVKRTYQNMLQESQQMHVLISGDIAVSGEARRQAMADFVQSLLNSRPVVEAAVRWLLETLLAMAAEIMGDAKKYEGLRATCDVRIEAGPMMAEDMRMVMEAVAQKLMSRDTAQNRLGIDDVQAEDLRIEQDVKWLAEQNKILMPEPGPAGVGGKPTVGDNSSGGQTGKPKPESSPNKEQ